MLDLGLKLAALPDLILEDEDLGDWADEFARKVEPTVYALAYFYRALMEAMKKYKVPVCDGFFKTTLVPVRSSVLPALEGHEDQVARGFPRSLMDFVVAEKDE